MADLRFSLSCLRTSFVGLCLILFKMEVSAACLAAVGNSWVERGELWQGEGGIAGAVSLTSGPRLQVEEGWAWRGHHSSSRRQRLPEVGAGGPLLMAVMPSVKPGSPELRGGCRKEVPDVWPHRTGCWRGHGRLEVSPEAWDRSAARCLCHTWGPG